MSQSFACDVFLSYNSRDHVAVEGIANKLRAQGLKPFLDRWYLAPGLRWRPELEKTLAGCEAVAVFFGPDGMGSWQQREVDVALDRQSQDPAFAVIPVLLPGCEPPLGFLRQNTWADLRNQPEPGLLILAKAIRGEPPGHDLQEQFAATRASLCPYRGLLYFREEDATLFFGRDQAIEGLTAAVRKNHFLALVGASGSGKSSVVRAGLVPQLRRDRDTIWEIATLVPGDQPLKVLAAALLPFLEPTMTETDRLAEVGKLAGHFASSTVSLRDVVQRVLAKQPGTDRLLLVADQWEELYTLTRDAEARRRFMDELLDASVRGPLTVVLTLRGDFVGKALAYRPLCDRLQNAQINLGPMTRAELERAVTQPAAQVGLAFEPGLAERILDDVGDEPGHLPLLEFVLRRLWEERHHGQLLHEAYEKMGGLHGAVAHKAEQFYSRLSGSNQEAIQRVFLQLVRPGETGEDTRRRERLADIPESSRELVKQLADERLLVTSTAAESADETVEVAHEALIRHWDLLKNWLSRDREFLLWRDRLRMLVAEWQRNARDKNSLLRGPALAEARRWLDERKRDLTDVERQFIKSSLQIQRRSRRVRVAILAIILVLVAAGVGLKFWIDTAFRVRAAVIYARMGPMRGVSASAISDWLHAVDVAGMLDQLGDTVFDLPDSDVRLRTLLDGVRFFAYQGRKDEASRLTQRALEVAKEVKDFESSFEALGDMALALHAAGENAEAVKFAQRAAAAARFVDSPEARVAAIARVSQLLARVGLTEQAETAITESRQQSKSLAEPYLQGYVDAMVTPTLVRLGRVEEATRMTLAAGDPIAWPMLTQVLIDTGRLNEGLSTAKRSQHPFAMAIAGSALVSAGRLVEARDLTQTALRQLGAWPMSPAIINRVRELMLRRVLLQVASAEDVLGFVRGLDDAEALAMASKAFARTGASDRARQAVDEAERKARGSADIRARARVLGAIVESLAIVGDAERALEVARGIDVPEFKAAAMAEAALGFADLGKKERATALLKEVDPLLPTIADMEQQSRAWASAAKVRVRLGDYAAATSPEKTPLPDDRIAVFTAILRDDAIRRNPKLEELFKAGPVKGLGRFGSDWP